jgi:hypothetical protein
MFQGKVIQYLHPQGQSYIAYNNPLEQNPQLYCSKHLKILTIYQISRQSTGNQFYILH